MDIFTHTLSGMAAATAIAATSSRSLKEKFLMIGCGAAGAMFPDLDAVTRWPDFDAVIGKALGPKPAAISTTVSTGTPTIISCIPWPQLRSSPW